MFYRAQSSLDGKNTAEILKIISNSIEKEKCELKSKHDCVTIG